MSDKKRKKRPALKESDAAGLPSAPKKRGKPITFDPKLYEQTPRAKGSEQDPPEPKKNEPVREEELPKHVDTYADMAKEEEAKAIERQEKPPQVPQMPVPYIKPFNPRMIDGRLGQAWTTTVFGTPCGISCQCQLT